MIAKSAPFVTTVVASVGAATVVVFAPDSVTIGVIIGSAVVAVLVAGVAKYRQDRARWAPPVAETTAPVPPPVEPAGVDVARWLFYAGLATLAEITVRRGPFTISDWLFLAALLVAVGDTILRRRSIASRAIPRAFVLGVAVYAAGAVFSSINAASPRASLVDIARVVYLLLAWFWLTATVLQNTQQIRRAMNWWTISVAVTALGAVAQVVFGFTISGGYASYGRATGFTNHVNQLGGAAAIALVPAAMLAVFPRQRAFQYVVAYAVLIAVGFGLTLSGSVDGLITAALGLLLWVLLGVRRRLTIAIAVGAAVVGLLVFTVATQQKHVASPFSRLSLVAAEGGPQSGTLISRVDTYRVAWERIQKDPFLGVGSDVGSRVAIRDFEVHNIFLSRWFTSGLLGLIGFVLALGALFSVAWRTMIEADGDDETLLARGLFIAVIAFLAFAQGAPIVFDRFAWVPVALLFSLRAVQLRRRAGSAETASHFDSAAGPRSVAPRIRPALGTAAFARPPARR